MNNEKNRGDEHMLPNEPVAAITPEVVAWRHAIHANPELGFHEHRTAAFVADRLR